MVRLFPAVGCSPAVLDSCLSVGLRSSLWGSGAEEKGLFSLLLLHDLSCAFCSTLCVLAGGVALLGACMAECEQ